MNIDKRYLSRKWQLAVASFLAGVVFFSVGMFSSTEWIAYTQWVLALYLAGNVLHKAAEKVS